ncbi:MAG TPA: hypothetical protein VFV33_13770, partial [Gemmatimonadaceae bacterium]|nr:hypothetical protein [Gemmatimonadaceae bacterium]
EIGNGGKGSGGRPALATVMSERFTQVSAGANHACAVTVAGFAFCWGRDELGQLGDNRRINSTTPIPVVGPNGLQASALQFSDISAGDAHTCGITIQGAAYCWGNGAFGQLGNGQLGASDVPVPVQGALVFTSVSAGANHSCAVTTGGALYCWGSNERGQLGVPSGPTVITTPVLVGQGYSAVSAGALFTCALTTTQAVHCFGSNRYGQLGRGEGNPSGQSAVPTNVVSGLSFRSITAGNRHVCALATDGDTYCWGSNVFGALGNELQAAVRAIPQKVAPPR